MTLVKEHFLGDSKGEAITGSHIIAFRCSIWIHFWIGLALSTRSCSSHSSRSVCVSCYGQSRWWSTVVLRCSGPFATGPIFYIFTGGTKSWGGSSSPSRADEGTHSGLCCWYHWKILFLTWGSVSCVGLNLWMEIHALLLEIAPEG
jgi:hypothetical protein